MEIFYVYKSLAHPEKDGFVQPLTLEERLAHVAEATRRLDTRIPWLADSMENDLKHAFGDKNNSEFVISPEGEVLIARNWSDPDQLREDLAALVGESESVTRVADLDRDPQSAHAVATHIERGVVPRVKRPSNGTVLQVRAIASPQIEGEESPPSDEPRYVKLRAEAPRSLLESGSGTLYLGFHLDPIYQVHWNNLAAPLEYRVTAPEGVTVSEATGTAPEVEEANADLDPREFLVEVDFGETKPDSPLLVEVSYFACDNAETFCKALTQVYEVHWRPDRDAGRVQSGGNRGSAGGMTRRPGGNGGNQRRMPDPQQLITRMDRNDDGKIAKDEAQGQMVQRFDQMDGNDDGFVTTEEIQAAFERMRESRQPPSR